MESPSDVTAGLTADVWQRMKDSGLVRLILSFIIIIIIVVVVVVVVGLLSVAFVFICYYAIICTVCFSDPI